MVSQQVWLCDSNDYILEIAGWITVKPGTDTQLNLEDESLVSFLPAPTPHRSKYSFFMQNVSTSTGEMDIKCPTVLFPCFLTEVS